MDKHRCNEEVLMHCVQKEHYQPPSVDANSKSTECTGLQPSRSSGQVFVMGCGQKSAHASDSVLFVQGRALEADLFGHSTAHESDHQDIASLWPQGKSEPIDDWSAAATGVSDATHSIGTRAGRKAKKAAWVDADDGQREMHLAAVPKLRKLQHHHSENVISGVPVSGLNQCCCALPNTRRSACRTVTALPHMPAA